MRGVRNPSISPFFSPLGSGSTSRLFLVIRSLVFSAEWLFYQPLWFFLLASLASQLSVWGVSVLPLLLRPPYPYLFSHAPFLPLFPPLLFSPGGTAIQSVCTDDLCYHQHHSKWIYSPSSFLRWPPTLSCLYRNTWLSKFFSLTLMHATGPMINGETWPIMYVDRDYNTTNQGSNSLEGLPRQLLHV